MDEFACPEKHAVSLNEHTKYIHSHTHTQRGIHTHREKHIYIKMDGWMDAYKGFLKTKS